MLAESTFTHHSQQRHQPPYTTQLLHCYSTTTHCTPLHLASVCCTLSMVLLSSGVRVSSSSSLSSSLAPCCSRTRRRRWYTCCCSSRRLHGSGHEWVTCKSCDSRVVCYSDIQYISGLWWSCDSHVTGVIQFPYILYVHSSIQIAV